MNDSTNNILSLIDDDGVEQEFELLAAVEHEEVEYLALSPLFDDPQEYIDSDGEIIILRVDEDADGESTLSSIDDDGEFELIWGKFQTLLEEEYDIEQ